MMNLEKPSYSCSERAGLFSKEDMGLKANFNLLNQCHLDLAQINFNATILCSDSRSLFRLYSLCRTMSAEEADAPPEDVMKRREFLDRDI